MLSIQMDLTLTHSLKLFIKNNMKTTTLKLNKQLFNFFAFLLTSLGVFAQPANDNPCNAINLTVGSSCNSQSYTTVSATASSVTNPSCAGSSFLDVWFTFTVPASGNVTVDSQTGTMTDSGMAWYTGTCGALTQMACDDDSGAGLMSMISSSTLTPGAVIYVRFWRYSGTGTFGICAYSPPPPPTMPTCGSNSQADDNCTNAPPICNLDGYCGNTSASYTATTGWSQLTSAFCGASLENDSFIKFVADSTAISFYVWQTSSLNGDGIQMLIFSSNTCGSGAVTGYGCYNPIAPSNSPTLVTATGLTPGQTYRIIIDGYAGDVCNYVIGLPNGSGGIALPASISPATSNICLGQSVNLAATGGNGTYDWTTSPNAADLNSTNAANVTATPTTIGTSTYVITTLSGPSACPNSNTDTAFVFVMTTPTAGNGTTDTICALSSSTVSGATSNGGVVWTIQSGAGTLTNASTLTPTYHSVAADAGNHVILEMTVTGCGGSAISHDTIFVLPTLYANIDGNMFYCPNSGSTHLSLPDSLFLDSVQWKLNGNVINTNFTANLTAGTYDISVWGINSLCTKDTTITITSQPSVVLENDQVVCFPSTSYTFVNNTGGSGNGTWSTLGSIIPTPTFSSNAMNNTVTMQAFGSFSLVYTDNNCLDKDTVIISFEKAPYFNLDTNLLACPGSFKHLKVNDSLNLTGMSWNWPTNPISSNYSSNFSAGGPYNAHLVSTNGCINDTTFSITTITPVQLVYTGGIDCNDSSVVLNQNIGGPIGQWTSLNNPGVTFTPANNISTTIHVPHYGDYQFVFTEPVCNDDDTVTIKFRPDQYVDLYTEFTICIGFEQELLSFPFADYEQYITSYIWTKQGNSSVISNSNSINVTEAGYYICTVTGECASYSDSTLITIKVCDIELPNTFTPNNDGNNDYFKLIGDNYDFFKTFNISIVNRWGNVVAEFSDANFKWNGQDKNGNLVENGVYFYSLKSTTIEDTELNRQGFIQVFTDK